MLDYQIFWLIRQYLYRPKFLQVILCHGPQRMCTCHSYSFHHKKTSVIMGFPLVTHGCKSLIQHLVQLHYLRLFLSLNLKRFFTLELDTINECNWSFCFFILYTIGNPVLYEAMTSLGLRHFQAS